MNPKRTETNLGEVVVGAGSLSDRFTTVTIHCKNYRKDPKVNPPVDESIPDDDSTFNRVNGAKLACFFESYSCTNDEAITSACLAFGRRACNSCLKRSSCSDRELVSSRSQT